MDALVDFMQTKRNTEKLENGGIPPNIEEMLEAFALRVETLTPAERTVLQYYIEGYTIQEIASLLYISIGTARKHNTNMNRKLGITAREELMLYIDLFRKCNQLDKLFGPYNFFCPPQLSGQKCLFSSAFRQLPAKLATALHKKSRVHISFPHDLV